MVKGRKLINCHNYSCYNAETKNMHVENLLNQCNLVCCGSQNGSTMELIKLIVQILLLVVAFGALWQGF